MEEPNLVVCNLPFWRAANHTIDIIYKSLLGKWNILLISRSWPVVGLSWHGQSHSFAMDWSNLDHIIELRALRNLINFHLTLRFAFSLQHWMSVPRLLGNGNNGKVLSVIISDWITFIIQQHKWTTSGITLYLTLSMLRILSSMLVFIG